VWSKGLDRGTARNETSNSQLQIANVAYFQRKIQLSVFSVDKMRV
jgi:hypothetical protein